MALEFALAELAAQKATDEETGQMMAHLEVAQKVIRDDVEFVRVEEQARAIACHDVDAARAAARRHMYLERKIFPADPAN